MLHYWKQRHNISIIRPCLKLSSVSFIRHWLFVASLWWFVLIPWKCIPKTCKPNPFVWPYILKSKFENGIKELYEWLCFVWFCFTETIECRYSRVVPLNCQSTFGKCLLIGLKKCRLPKLGHEDFMELVILNCKRNTSILLYVQISSLGCLWHFLKRSKRWWYTYFKNLSRSRTYSPRSLIYSQYICFCSYD